MFCSMTHFKHQSTFSPHFPSCTITFKALSILQFEPPRNMAYTAHFAVLFKWMHHSSGRSNEWILFTKDARDRPIVTWSLSVTFFFCAGSHLWWKPVNFVDIADIETNRCKVPNMPILRSNLQMSGLFSPRYADKEDRVEWWPWILEGHIRWHLCQL